MHVLLLEDQARVREVLANALERSGWSVSQAATLADAHRCLSVEGPHVVVADRHLAGGEDGHAFAAAAYTARERLAVIYISASAVALKDRVLRNGEWSLAKPFMPAALVDAVTRATRHFRPTRE